MRCGERGPTVRGSKQIDDSGFLFRFYRRRGVTRASAVYSEYLNAVRTSFRLPSVSRSVQKKKVLCQVCSPRPVRPTGRARPPLSPPNFPEVGCDVNGESVFLPVHSSTSARLIVARTVPPPHHVYVASS